MDRLDSGVAGGTGAVGDSAEIGHESFGPVGCLAFVFHRIKEHVTGEVVDEKDEVGVASDGGDKWSGDVAEQTFTRAGGGGSACGVVWQAAGCGELATFAGNVLARGEAGWHADSGVGCGGGANSFVVHVESGVPELCKGGFWEVAHM